MRILLLIMMMLACAGTKAQEAAAEMPRPDTLRISLEDAILRARARSVDAAVALNLPATQRGIVGKPEYMAYRGNSLSEYIAGFSASARQPGL